MTIGVQELAPGTALLTELGMDRRMAAAVEEVGRFVETLRQAGAGVGMLSKDGAESFLRSLLLDLITAGLGELGIGLDKILNFKQLIVNTLVEEIAYWSGVSTAPPTSDLLADAGLRFDRSIFRSEAATRARQLAEGKAVANGKAPTRNAAKTGDPIVLGRGEFERETTDLVVSGAAMDFTFRRTYRSGAAYVGPLGPGWDHGYNLRLREDNHHVLVRLTGRLSEHRFVRHPRFGEAGFSYYSPTDGVHDVVVDDGTGSFALHRPDGGQYLYEATDQPGEHRVRRIEDRFGNYLAFAYSPEDRLERVSVNSPHRHVTFRYDDRGRIRSLEDHMGRIVLYDYDEWGYLAAASGAALPGETADLRDRYAYAPVVAVRKLTRVLDWQDRPLVENEYDPDPLSDSFGYVVRQAQNRGESTFFYQPLQNEVDPAVPRQDVPALRVEESRRNGHQIVHVLNRQGNELMTRERVVEGCRVRDRVTQYRYNADGQPIARIDPDSALTQYLFQREHTADAVDWPDLDVVLADVTMQERMAFGNLLAVVKRGRRVPSDPAIANGDWAAAIRPVKQRDDPDDWIVKYRYHHDCQLTTSSSDPRHTASPDPLHVESALAGEPGHDSRDRAYIEHQRFLTRFEYGPAPRLELRRKLYPDRTLPSPLDGVDSITGIAETYQYDARGRLLVRIDPGGYEWRNEYYAASADPALRAKEGFLERTLISHFELSLDSDVPDILEVRKQGGWHALATSLRSDGTIGDALELSVEGVRILLRQATNGQIVSAHDAVAVTLDGVALPPWDQTADASYLVDDLVPGIHTVRIEDTVGRSLAIGRVQSHVAQEYDLDDLGRVRRETDGRGHATTYDLDARDRLRRITRGASIVEYEYDPADRLVLERAEWRDAAGALHPERAVVKRYCYDPGGLLLSASIGSEHDGASRTTRHRYDSEDRRWETRDPRGGHTFFDYDELNRQIRVVRAACAPEVSTLETSYDAADRVLALRNARGALRLNGYRGFRGEWHSGIDAHGRVRVKSDPLGHRTVTDHDALDHPLVVRQFERGPGGAFTLLSRGRISYDEHGDTVQSVEAVFPDPIPTAVPVNAPDAAFDVEFAAGAIQEAVTDSYRDARGSIVATRSPDNAIARRRVDGQQRVYDETDAEEARTFQIYDGTGNVVRRYRFDPVRDPATGAVIYREVFLELREYDEFGHEKLRVDPYGNRWRQEYDSLGNRTRSEDPLGNVVRFEYDAFGAEVTQTEERTASGLGGGAPLPPLVTWREYDANGNVIALTNPAQRRTVFEYDALDRLVRTRFDIGPNQPTEERTYDRAGNLVAVTTRAGLVLRHAYDLADRHRRTVVDASALPAADSLSPLSATFECFQYDGAGRLAHHSNDYCVVEIRRDSRGLPTRERVTVRGIGGAPAPLTVMRRFDLGGRRTELVYPSGREVAYDYDYEGRVVAVRNAVAATDYPGRPANAIGLLIRYMFAGDRLIGSQLGNGLRAVLRYDGCGRVLERAVARADNTVVWRLQRLRDAGGFTRIETATGRAADRSRKFSLDSLSRLVAYTDIAANWIDPATLAPPQSPVDPLQANGQAVLDAAIGPLAPPPPPPVFAYDATSNRVASHEPGLPPSQAAVDALDRYLAVDGVAWRHDADGNLRSDGACTFAYDLHGALQVVSDRATGARQAAYYRDALGRVVAEATAAGTSFRIYDGYLPLVDLDAQRRVEWSLDHLSGTVIHAARDAEDYWLARDGLGSLRLLTDSRGNRVSIPLYRPFGASEDGELALSPFGVGFGGMWFTRGVSFLHSRTRSYRADVGRYLQRDPAGQSNDLNAYGYAGNNPVDRWDPRGLEDEAADVAFLQVPPKPPLSLATQPGEFQLFSVLDRPDLSDFQKQLVLDELMGRRPAADRRPPTTLERVAPILLPKLPPPSLIYNALLFNLMAPFEVASFIAAPVTTALQLGFSEAVGYGAKRGLVAAGVSEQTAGWVSVGAAILAGHFTGTALKAGLLIQQNRTVGVEFENYVQATKLRGLDDAGLLETQQSVATRYLIPDKYRIRPDWAMRDRDLNIAAIGDAKTSDYIPYDLQAHAFVELAQGTTTRQLIYYVPGPTTLDSALVAYAQSLNVRLRLIVVP